ncbi:1-acyl-sn-glycerol-3-phosphate acyltransferase [Calidifontibacter sp. DB0510]|uniref:1-acyl-sn-glycerol-3-phosphate acyltransferase n=1 Tax=Metallococcus carri TaxID=1656884 RepID=A0A967AYP3_9MICO|nr:lysophospholipid acyltransferase family protein [Metallococcus carri]NHN54862.1 1-acyl-sn-glycerol-3-phosphate acyltransferase [Metallococcus carri]NOP37207.1 1-acyl-sn-glycerol-3-phosphate acyltransferase [Calidifontibacter sp. DB2511S]
MEPVYTPIIRTALGLFKAQGLRITRLGTEHIPRTGGAVVAINHISYMDFAYAGYPFHDVGRKVRFMAKKEVFANPVAGPLLRGMGHIPVDRAAGAGSYREAVRELREGELVGVFPEATISRSFELKEFKTGAVRMSQEAGVPVLPLVVWGSQRVWTKGVKRRMGRTGIPISLTVGEPMHFADVDAATGTAELKTVMQQMLEKAQADYPALTGEELRFLPHRLGGTAPTIEEAAELDRQALAERAAKKAAKKRG